MHRGRIILVLLVASACTHSEPFPPRDNGTDQPFVLGPPPRLTANVGEDRGISFTPDEAFLLYALDLGSMSCLGLIPQGEARAARWICPRPVEFVVDRYSKPAVSPDGRLAFVLSRQRENEAGSFYTALLTAPLAHPGDTTEIVPIPFRTADGILHRTIDRAGWLRGDTLVVLADGVLYLTDPANAERPREFLALTQPERVTGMQPSVDGLQLFLTFAGDSRISAWQMGTRAQSTVYDVGSEPVSIFAMGSGTLAAATSAGVLRVNLANGSRTVLPAFALEIRELAISPDGSDIIASAVDPGKTVTTDLYRLSPRP